MKIAGWLGARWALSLLAGMLFGLAEVSAQAEFELPDSVYHIDRLEEAKKEAAQKKQPIVILLSLKTSNCGSCKAASLDTVETFDPVAVIVYGAPMDQPKFPTNVWADLSSPEMGASIPRVLVYDTKLQTVLGRVSARQLKMERKKLFPAILEKIGAAAPNSGQKSK